MKDYTKQTVRLRDGREAWVEGRVGALAKAGKLGRSSLRLPDSAWYVKIQEGDVLFGHIVFDDAIVGKA